MSRNRRHIRIRIFSSRIVFNPFRDETQGMETYPDLGEGQTQETYYEYDYNEISGPTSNLPLADIQAHPENYLEYAYSPAASDPGTQALAEVQKLEAAIERGLTI